PLLCRRRPFFRSVLLLLLLPPRLFRCPCTSASVIFPLSLHDALPILGRSLMARFALVSTLASPTCAMRTCLSSAVVAAELKQVRSEEHTSELQSRFDLVCRLLLEQKKADSTMCAIVRSKRPVVSVSMW